MDLDNFEKIFRQKIAKKLSEDAELAKQKVGKVSGFEGMIESSRIIASQVCSLYLIDVILPILKETLEELNKKENKKEV